ncbi:MAG: hypothetical protein GTO18_09175 [Anaerolineales bacterium]|nr:hypothetical protein [Anaerolineales bacterium]
MAVSGDGSFGSPFKTIQEGLDALTPGWTVYIRGDGTGRYYYETLTFSTPGTSALPMTVRPYMDEKVIIASSSTIFDLNQPYWKFVDLIFDHQNGSSDAIQIHGGDYALFDNCEIRNGQKYAIEIFDGDSVTIQESLIHSFDSAAPGSDAHCIVTDPTLDSRDVTDLYILNNTIYDCSGDAIHLYAETTTDTVNFANNVMISGNTIYKTGGFYGESGITVRGGLNVTIENNTLYGFDVEQAIDILMESSNVTIKDNTIRNSIGGINVSEEAGRQPQSITLLRNTIHDISGTFVISVNGLIGGTFHNNTLSSNAGSSFEIVGNGLTLGDIQNNLIHDSGIPVITGPFTGTGDYNGWFNTLPGGLTSANDTIGVDPLFVNPGAGDFCLQIGSDAIDAGTFLGYPFLGLAPDLGACESY